MTAVEVEAHFDPPDQALLMFDLLKLIEIVSVHVGATMT